MQIVLLVTVAWERTQNRMSAHVIPEGPGTPKRQKFPFLRGSLGFGARESKTGITSIACSIATCMTRGVGHRLASLDVFWGWLRLALLFVDIASIHNQYGRIPSQCVHICGR